MKKTGKRYSSPDLWVEYHGYADVLMASGTLGDDGTLTGSDRNDW